MNTQTATATHEVIRPGISLGAGNALVPGDRVDASGWRPGLVHSWEQRGVIRRLTEPTAPTADAGSTRRRRED